MGRGVALKEGAWLKMRGVASTKEGFKPMNALKWAGAWPIEGAWLKEGGVASTREGFRPTNALKWAGAWLEEEGAWLKQSNGGDLKGRDAL